MKRTKKSRYLGAIDGSPRDQEDRIAERLGGKRVRGSGASQYSKGDVREVEAVCEDSESIGFLVECVAPDTPVLVDSCRYIDAGNVSVGDFITGGDGEEHEVLGVSRRPYCGYGIRICTFSDCRDVVFTPEHPVWVYRDGEGQFVSARDVSEGDYVYRPWSDCRNVDIAVKIKGGAWAKKKSEFCIDVDSGFARLLGYYVAEGWTHQGKVFFSFGCHEEDSIVADVIALIDRYFGEKPYVRYTDWNSIELRYGNAAVARWFEGECGSSAKCKRVPAIICDGSRDVVIGFLRGVLLGDGCGDDVGVHFATHSIALADGVRGLLMRLKIPSSLGETSKGGWQLRMFGVHGQFVRWIVWGERIAKIGRKSRIFLTDEHGLYIKIKSVDVVSYDGDVINYEVMDDHRFVCLNMVVHNCKQTIHASMSVKWEWLRKITKEANAVQKEPALAIEIQGGVQDPLCDRDWVAVPARVFERLTKG